MVHNEAHSTESGRILGNPMDVALYEFLTENQLPTNPSNDMSGIAEFPFDSSRKCASRIIQSSSGYRSLVKMTA